MLETESESSEAIRNLVLLVASLSFCGHTELKVDFLSSTIYELDSFKLPEPENRGSTVRNVHAFAVLQSVFSRAQSERLSTIVLDAIATVYNADGANYFLLERQNSLSQFAEKLSAKPASAQRKFYQLLEFVVVHLKHVPAKELVAVARYVWRNLFLCISKSALQYDLRGPNIGTA